jgi:hypothetical protein
MSEKSQEKNLRAFGIAVDRIQEIDGVVVLDQQAGIELDANGKWTEGTITIAAKEGLVDDD